MDVSFVLAAVIFTLLAIVVATSMFTGTSPSSDYGRGADGAAAAAKERASPAAQNGHVPSLSPLSSLSSWYSHPKRKPRKTEEFDWCEMSGSSHDHWDVVKNVLSEEETMSDLSRPESRTEPPSASSSGRSSFIGLSDSQLLKCAFSLPQTEGAAESPDGPDKEESNSNHSFRYLPGKSRSHHLQMMMSADELEEEQRVQREQLSAIFQLLKNNKDTFGDVSPGDMEEQLKLYSI